jgi:DnaJ-class molecular chaperone
MTYKYTRFLIGDVVWCGTCGGSGRLYYYDDGGRQTDDSEQCHVCQGHGRLDTVTGENLDYWNDWLKKQRAKK